MSNTPDISPLMIADFLKSHHYSRLTPVAALIDMDGTLYDSMPSHARAWHRMITELGIEADPDEFFMYEGMTGAATINLIFNRVYGRDATPDETERYYRLKTEYFSAMPPVSVMPGARDLVRFLVEVGIKRVLVTGSGQSSLINRLEADFDGAFSPDLRVTSRNVSHGKPHPEPYIRAMQMARVSPSAAVAFENAPLGVKSAADAGVFTVGVVTGPVPADELRKAGAAVVFDGMPQCAEMFPALLYNMMSVTID